MIRRISNPDTAVIFDCEFLALRESNRRFWCAPVDPDPVIVQIGAAKLSLTGDFAISDSARIFVKPVDRYGKPYRIDPFLTELTGITDETVAEEGVPLEEALRKLDRFSDGASFWSWGKDELNMMAISCYIAGIPATIPANRFDNACKLLLAAGMPQEDLGKVRSNRLADYYGIEHPPLRAHDGLDDALSVTYVLQHLLREGKLSPDHITSG